MLDLNSQEFMHILKYTRVESLGTFVYNIIYNYLLISSMTKFGLITIADQMRNLKQNTNNIGADSDLQTTNILLLGSADIIM